MTEGGYSKGQNTRPNLCFQIRKAYDFQYLKLYFSRGKWYLIQQGDKERKDKIKMSKWVKYLIQFCWMGLLLAQLEG